MRLQGGDEYLLVDFEVHELELVDWNIDSNVLFVVGMDKDFGASPGALDALDLRGDRRRPERFF
jgi:hypothetical protein